MKHSQLLLAFALILFVPILMLTGVTSGCLSKETKEITQFPALQLAWPGVKSDYERGIDDEVTNSGLEPFKADVLMELGAALNSAITEEDIEKLRTIPWNSKLQTWALRGISARLTDGEIGVTVAGELIERVNNFTATIVSLQGEF